MKTASAIMKKKRFIKDELDRQLPRTQSDDLWAKAEKRLDEILREYADIPKGEHIHADDYIFPCAAIYQIIKEEVNPETACRVIENAAIRRSTEAGRKLAKAMRIPALRSLFIRLWDPVTKKRFGPSCGFENVFYAKKKGEYRMDIVACPYCKYFSALGCPELTKVICANDDRAYGNLPGVEFIRTSTLGAGGDRCDFYLRKV